MVERGAVLVMEELMILPDYMIVNKPHINRALNTSS